jgi:hypothetical protein
MEAQEMHDDRSAVSWRAYLDAEVTGQRQC